MLNLIFVSRTPWSMKFIETAGYRSLQKDGAFCNLRDSNYTVIHKNKTSFTDVMKLCSVYVHHSPWRYFKMSSFEYQVVWFNWINKWTIKSIWQFFQTPAHSWGYVIQNQFLQIFVSNLLFSFWITITNIRMSALSLHLTALPSLKTFAQ